MTRSTLNEAVSCGASVDPKTSDCVARLEQVAPQTNVARARSHCRAAMPIWDIRRYRINLLRLMGLGFVVAAMFTVPAYELADWQWVALDLFGAFLLIGAVIGRFWAILHVGGRKSSEIVKSGPYALCRHPLYLFSLTGLAGICVMEGSLLIGAATLIVASAIFLRTMANEEHHLAARFPGDYSTYKAAVPLVIPRRFRAVEGGALVVSTRALFGKFRDALVFLLFIPLSEGLEVLDEAALIATIAVP